MAKDLPQLSVFLDSLENYALCERHYNQIVVNKSFVKRVTKPPTYSDSEATERKRPRLSKDNELRRLQKRFAILGSKYPCLIQRTKCFQKDTGARRF